MNKKILDMTCGSRTIWFNKNHPAAVYCDKRREDYDFTPQSPTYICGMSVPPVMMKRVVTRLIEQGVFAYKQEGDKHEET